MYNYMCATAETGNTRQADDQSMMIMMMTMMMMTMMMVTMMVIMTMMMMMMMMMTMMVIVHDVDGDDEYGDANDDLVDEQLDVLAEHFLSATWLKTLDAAPGDIFDHFNLFNCRCI